MDRIEHAGAAPTTTLLAPLAQGASAFQVVDGAGYPDGAAGRFYVTIDYKVGGVEETILCESRSGNTITVASGGRGASGSSDTTHEAGAEVIHSFPAQEAEDINLALIDLDTRATTLEGGPRVWSQTETSAIVLAPSNSQLGTSVPVTLDAAYRAVLTITAAVTNASATLLVVSLLVDGVTKSVSTTSTSGTVSGQFVFDLTAGAHTFQPKWETGAGATSTFQPTTFVVQFGQAL